MSTLPMAFYVPGLGSDLVNRCQRIAVNGLLERIERIRALLMIFCLWIRSIAVNGLLSTDYWNGLNG
jgi:hypothetical protein